MIQNARYLHTNLIARDWRALVSFYESVFGCIRVPPERDFSGPALESGTAVPGAALRGVHLRMPGFPESHPAPTLELFSYSRYEDSSPAAANRRGFTHIAFAVNSVADARAQVLASGGSVVGDIVTLTTATGTQITWCYVRDPEGNIIELQS